jgi:hypothetical protein
MFHQGPNGPSLVSEEFNQMCVAAHVEARVSSMPNPGDPYNALRRITFRNFATTTAKVTQYNKRKQIHTIPAKGGLEIMLQADEALPLVEAND